MSDFARRPGHRFNRGRLPFGVSAITPLTIVGAGDTVAWWRSDLGITLNGGAVSAWADQGSGGFHLTQGTGANQPTYNAAGGPNSTPSLLFDGTGHSLVNATIDRPAPGTQPTFLWGVLRQLTWTNGDRILGFGAVGTHMNVTQNPATPQWRQQNVTLANTNGGLALNTYGRFEVFFNNNTTDYIKLITTNVTGVNAGNTDPAAGLRLGCDSVGALFSNIEVCELAVYKVLPTAGQLAALDAYCTARYGAGLV